MGGLNVTSSLLCEHSHTLSPILIYDVEFVHMLTRSS
jgi:hypothetical protein